MYKRNESNYSRLILLFFSVLTLFVVTVVTRQSSYFENEVYVKYTESLLFNNNLDIFNHLKHPADFWLVNEKNYHPDFHFFTASGLLHLMLLPLQKINFLNNGLEHHVFNLIGCLFFVLSIDRMHRLITIQFGKGSSRWVFFYFLTTGSWLIVFEYPLMVDVIEMFFFTYIYEDLFINKDRDFFKVKSIFLPVIFIIKNELLIFSPFYFLFGHKGKFRFYSLLSFFVLIFLYKIVRLEMGDNGGFFPMSILTSPFSQLTLGWSKLFALDGLFFYSPFYVLFLIILWLELKAAKYQVWKSSLIFLAPVLLTGFVLFLCPLRVINLFFDRHFLPYSILFIHFVAKNESEFIKYNFLFPVVSFWAVIVKFYYFFSTKDSHDWGIQSTLNFNKYSLEGLINFIARLGLDQAVVIFTWLALLLLLYYFIKDAYVYILFFSFILTSFLALKNVNSEIEYRASFRCMGRGCYYDDFVDVYSIAIMQYRQRGDNENAARIEREFYHKLFSIKKDIQAIGHNHEVVCWKSNIRPSFWYLKDNFSKKQYLAAQQGGECLQSEIFQK